MKPTDPTDSSEAHLAPALAWVDRAHAQDELLREVAARVRRGRARRLSVAAAGVVLIVASMLALREWRTPVRPAMAASPAATTATITRPAVQVLPDGSKVELRDGARITFAYAADVREVTLVSGEAHFEVMPQASRPFVVHAGQVRVRAVGTAFSVQFAPQGVDVLVTEGTVRVTPGAAKGAEESSAFVSAGRRCTVDASDLMPRVEQVSIDEAGERLAWRTPQLEFSRTPLPEVISLMNQNASPANNIRLEIGDAELNQIKLSGFLRADNTEGLVRLLETNFHVRVERIEPRLILRKQE